MPSAISEHLRLLADETRMRILHLLDHEPLTVAELQELLDLSQSSVSGHLAKLKRCGYIHDHAEGSSHRYRLREDLEPTCAATWRAVGEVSRDEAVVVDDRARVAELRAQRGMSWVERVAGTLHREYAPGRTVDSLLHAFVACLRLGRCVDVGAGDGALIELLAPRCTELLCIDPAPAMVEAGNARLAELELTTVRFEQAKAEALPLADASCDHVLFIQSLQYIEDPAAALAEALRVLRPDGRLLVLTLAAHDYGDAERYGHRHRGFDAADLRRWLGGLRELEVHRLPPEPRPPRFESTVATGLR